jgi:hypothetical protein
METFSRRRFSCSKIRNPRDLREFWNNFGTLERAQRPIIIAGLSIELSKNVVQAVWPECANVRWMATPPHGIMQRRR